MTDEELVRQLRLPWFTNGCEMLQRKAADRIEALVKERDAAEQRGYANAMEAERKLHENRIAALTEQLAAARRDAEEAEAYAEELEAEIARLRKQCEGGRHERRAVEGR